MNDEIKWKLGQKPNHFDLSIPDFEILEPIGQGAISVVYLASQKTGGGRKRIALKLVDINFSSAEEMTNFLRESERTATLRHHHIVDIYQVGYQDNLVYIAMEYIEGISLDQKLKQDSLSEMEIWDIALQVCKALQEGLKINTIHENIKPQNILLDTKGMAKLTDFELSKNLSQNTQLSLEERTLESLVYLSPEQTSKRKKVDFRSDIYSLGAMTYHLLTAKPVFFGSSAREIIYKQKHGTIICPDRYNPSLSKKSCFILAKMLHKNPLRRYLSYGNLLRDIYALKRNKKLLFANHLDFIEVYEEPVKKLECQEVAVALSPSPFPPSHKYSDVERTLYLSEKIVMVSSPERVFLDNLVPVHFVESYPEMSLYLKKQKSLVILDSHYLKEKTVSFLQVLRAEFPDYALWILLEEVPKNVDQSKAVLFLTYQDWEERLFKALGEANLGDIFLGQFLKLRLIIILMTHLRWSGRLRVFEGGEKRGKIVICSGKIMRASHAGSKGKTALDAILKIDYDWRFFPEKREDIEKRMKTNRLIISSAEEMEEIALPSETTHLGAKINKAEQRRLETRRIQKESNSSLSGDLAQINLCEVLQILAWGYKTGCLTVSNDDEPQIFLEKGVIIGYESLDPDQEIYDLLFQTEGRFVFEADVMPEKKEIHLSVEALMFEAARITDESNQ